MKTKIGIAVALSHHLKVLLLEEVTSGLDPLIRDNVLSAIKITLTGNLGLTLQKTRKKQLPMFWIH